MMDWILFAAFGFLMFSGVPLAVAANRMWL